MPTSTSTSFLTLTPTSIITPAGLIPRNTTDALTTISTTSTTIWVDHAPTSTCILTLFVYLLGALGDVDAARLFTTVLIGLLIGALGGLHWRLIQARADNRVLRGFVRAWEAAERERIEGIETPPEWELNGDGEADDEREESWARGERSTDATRGSDDEDYENYM